MASLCSEFGVTRRTIQRDITALTCSLPIETVRGRYGGGVKLEDGYLPYRGTLSPEQARAVRKAAGGELLDREERRQLGGILLQFASPV